MTNSNKTNETKTADPVVTPEVVKPVETPKAESTPVVETPKAEDKPAESPKVETPKFDPEILNKIDYRWLAGLNTQATNETSGLLVGNRYSLGSVAQTSLVATIDGVEIKAIENFKPNVDPEAGTVEAYPPGSVVEVIKKGEKVKVTVLPTEIGKYLNDAGDKQKSLVDQIKKWYDNPQDTYEQDSEGSTVVRDMVRHGILARTLNLLVTSILGTGRADTVRALKFVTLLSNSAEDKQALVWALIPFATFDGMSLTNMTRESVYENAKARLAIITSNFGLAPKSEASAKADNGNNPKPVVTADAFAALAGRVSAPTKASQSQGTNTKQQNQPTGKPFDPTTITAAAKEGKPTTIQATPPVVSSTATKIDDPAQLEAIASAKAESEKKSESVESPKSESTEPTKTPEPIKPTEEKKTEETKTDK